VHHRSSACSVCFLSKVALQGICLKLAQEEAEERERERGRERERIGRERERERERYRPRKKQEQTEAEIETGFLAIYSIRRFSKYYILRFLGQDEKWKNNSIRDNFLSPLSGIILVCTNLSGW
jgi:hypothetical protein